MTTVERIGDRPPVPVYRQGQECPRCWGRAWIIGRILAECHACGTALPLQDGHGASRRFTQSKEETRRG